MVDAIVEPDEPTVAPGSTGRLLRHNFNALTTWRFLAALLVFLHHCEGKFGIPMRTFPLRRYAVTFFFVLSGFLLVSVYHNRKTSYRQFMATRIARLMPLHLIALALTIFCMWPHFVSRLQADFTTTIVSTISQVFLVQCWHPTLDSAFTGNGVTWSICVLMFFYAVFPLLLKWRRYAWLILLVTIAGTLFLLKMVAELSAVSPSFYDPIRVAHIYPPFRLVEFLMGIVVAQVYLKGISPKLTDRIWLATVIEVLVLLIVFVGWVRVERVVMRQIKIIPDVSQIVIDDENTKAAFVTLNSTNSRIQSDGKRKAFVLRRQFDGKWFYFDEASHQYVWARWFRYTSFAIPVSLLIVWFTVSQGLISRLFRQPFLVWWGSLAYALFLVHYPVITIVHRVIGNDTISSTAAVLLCLAIAIGISVLLNRLIEEPVRKHVRRYFKNKQQRLEA